jgi:kumamolisin
VKTLKAAFVILCLLVAALPWAFAQGAGSINRGYALPYPTASTPKALDLGPLTAQGATPISITVALKLRDANAAENLLQDLYRPGSPQYHQFLTGTQFAERFAPTASDVAKIVAGLSKYGLLAERTSATTLRVTGSPADMERAFAVRLHSYQVGPHGDARGYSFHAPLSHPVIPAELSAWVAAVAGLDSRPSLRPLHRSAAQALVKMRPLAHSAGSGNPPGFLTVTDFAARYDVQPLYQEGISGNGRTVGIVTLASFTPSDAFAYWSALGLKVSANRITVVNVDGGPGAPSDASGSLETTVDVEQSGGLAPGANVVVYQAPNTSQGFVDGMAAAVDSNVADTVSVSWGLWEWYQNLENSPVTDPITGNTVGLATAFHELFVRAAIQGQSMFSASGDSGAYDINGDFGCSPESSPSCSLVLSVDNPSSDPAITAAGGTTLPGLQEYCLNAACTPPYYDVTIKREQVWGWDYLDGLCATLGFDPIACGIFPAGSGGGVSIIFREPWYQLGIDGVQRSQPHQEWSVDGQLIYALPPHYPGRNVPDVSANADPETGYVVYYTSSNTGFAPEPGWGGTSFVAPQLNGVTSLLDELFHGRVGLLNFALYGLAQSGQAYAGRNPPLHAIRDGDNWFYHGTNGYNPAAGLGILDVANFAAAIGHD